MILQIVMMYFTHCVSGYISVIADATSHFKAMQCLEGDG